MPPEAWPAGLPGHATAPTLRSPSAALALGLCLLLSACVSNPVAAPPVVTAPSLPPAPTAPAPVAVVTPPAPPPAPAPAVMSPLESLLATVDRQRSLGPAELAAELARLGETPSTPPQQMQLALLLLQTHQPVDTARALALLQRVAGSESPDATGLRPLARLLAGRVQELRRLEDQQERQTQQLRDAQRRIDQLSERLEAMRAIERSLGPRPPAAGNGRTAP